jgi:hypothetical protein
VADSVCSGWTPRSPVRLYVASGDEQVATADSSHCHAAFGAHGAHASVVELGTANYQGSRHLGSAVAGTAAIIRWLTRQP